MPRNPVDFADNELDNLIENHRRLDKLEAKLYIDCLAERARRSGKGLSFDKTFAVVMDAAKDGRFLSYNELATSSGAKWTQVNHSVAKHLGHLVEYADRRGWPMLSAVVVNKPNVATGKMDPDKLDGFVTAARALGYTVDDAMVFLKEQQQRVFDWAREQADAEMQEHVEMA